MITIILYSNWIFLKEFFRKSFRLKCCDLEAHCTSKKIVRICENMVVVDFCYVTQGILMSLVGTCGIVGNILAIIVITRREMKVTSTNYVLMGMK